MSDPCVWLLPSADDDVPHSTPSFDELTAAADRYLHNLGCSLYGRSWGLWDSGYEDAVAWLAGEVANVLAEVASPTTRAIGGIRD